MFALLEQLSRSGNVKKVINVIWKAIKFSGNPYMKIAIKSYEKNWK